MHTETTKPSHLTHELLRSWAPCEGAYKRFCELFPEGADLKTAVEGLVADGHDDWGFWLFSRCQDKGLFGEYTANGYRNAGKWNAGNGNAGNGNAGNWNTGYRNAGNWNTGYGNAGNGNAGNGNAGDRNTGYRNAGDRNTGNWNAGNWNAGDRNTGNWNAGNWNAGNGNAGNWNAGDRNTGNWNAGNWNAGDRNTGHFNTTTSDIISVFNKPCSVKDWESAKKPDFLYFNTTEWVYECDMSDEEKIANPKFYVMGGYLKNIDFKTAFQKSWDRADEKERILVKNLPNFDAEIFFEISGIDLREGA